MPKETITRDDYLKLLGLSTLAKGHNEALEDIVKAAVQITGEEDARMGHTADAIYGNDNVDQLLERLDITVES